MLRYVFTLTMLCGSSAFAAETVMPWDIASVSIVKISDEITTAPAADDGCSSTAALPSLSDGLDLGQIINVGEQVWKIIEAGKPVVTVKTPVAFALPRGLKCWNELENWQPTHTQTYEAAYKNGFGMEVVKFRFRLQYTAGGGLQGKGHYLANVSVLPAELNVLWGYTFDADVQVAQPVNLGTLDNPTAGLELNVNWNLKTVVKESRNSLHYFVQGDGQVLTAN
jgi:hypothetical protein